MSLISEKLITEEFNQLHDHLREHERAIGSLTIVMITASVTMISAVGIFYFRVLSQDAMAINILFSYLFLAPVFVVFPLMSSIRGHRESLYKIGLYIKIFYEEEFGGALWHVRLEKYQKYHGSESQDSVPYFAWIICAIAYTFFLATLRKYAGIPNYHYYAYAPIIFIIPILTYQHWRYGRIKGQYIEEAWRKTKSDMVEIADSSITSRSS